MASEEGEKSAQLIEAREKLCVRVAKEAANIRPCAARNRQCCLLACMLGGTGAIAAGQSPVLQGWVILYLPKGILRFRTPEASESTRAERPKLQRCRPSTSAPIAGCRQRMTASRRTGDHRLGTARPLALGAPMPWPGGRGGHADCADPCVLSRHGEDYLFAL